MDEIVNVHWLRPTEQSCLLWVIERALNLESGLQLSGRVPWEDYLNPLPVSSDALWGGRA